MLDDLYPTTYRILFEDTEGQFASVVYADAATLDEGVDVAVAAGEEIAGIDVEMATAGAIAGIVRDAATSTPIPGILVEAYAMRMGSWSVVGVATSSAAGLYTIGGLRTEVHRVGFSDPHQQYLPQFYEHAMTVEEGTDVMVSAGATNQHVNAQLRLGARIEGTVTAAATGDRLAEIVVTLWYLSEAGWVVVARTFTDEEGQYLFAPLQPGLYIVEFMDDLDEMFVGEYYEGVAFFEDATVIQLNEGQRRMGVDAALQSAATLTGRVVDAEGRPIEGILAVALVETAEGWWWEYRWDVTSVDGSYGIRGLRAGAYRVGLRIRMAYMPFSFSAVYRISMVPRILL